MPDTVAAALREAAAALQPLFDTARLDAELLMAHALGTTRSDLLLRHMGARTPPGFAALLSRRRAHEPIAYIVGEQEFRSLSFKVTADVLIPRGDSEIVVEAALAARPQAQRVLDCGTGSGALLLAVLAELREATGVGIDRSAAALTVASENAARLGLARRVRMACADWETAGWSADIDGPFDLILANPPYVEIAADLAPSVCGHEPAGALFAGADGLDAYRVLMPQIPGLLEPEGVAIFEIGYTQAEAVTRLAEAAGFGARLHRDLGARPRALELRRIT